MTDESWSAEKHGAEMKRLMEEHPGHWGNSGSAHHVTEKQMRALMKFAEEHAGPRKDSEALE